MYLCSSSIVLGSSVCVSGLSDVGLLTNSLTGLLRRRFVLSLSTLLSTYKSFVILLNQVGYPDIHV